MRALFDPDRHEQLDRDHHWDEEKVIHWLQNWGQDALRQAQSGVPVFPVHPDDAQDLSSTQPTSLYCGALGVWLALERLMNAQLIPVQDTSTVYPTLHQLYTAQPDSGENVPSWFLGESALLTQWCLQHKAPESLQNQLRDCIKKNLTNPTQEILWGAPGTFLAALFMWEATAEKSWRTLCEQHLEVLWQHWEWHSAHGAWLWTQELYGKTRIFMGAGHGWASNIYALWRAEPLLNDSQYNQLRERTLGALKTQALSHADTLTQTHAGAINWPPLADQDTNLLMQWCHGAPGVICALQRADLPELDAWLYKGGLSILEAGPLKKGPSLCHGTAGNGYALLYLHQRLRSKLPAHLPPLPWLRHARQFAMHALKQSEAQYATHGDWRYSLWTGDAGLACFLLDCLQERGHLPGIEAF